MVKEHSGVQANKQVSEAREKGIYIGYDPEVQMKYVRDDERRKFSEEVQNDIY